jgi:putative NADPH-quinone reductase
VDRENTIIQGHPGSAGQHLCHALADAYRKGAESAGFEFRSIAVGSLTFRLIRHKEDGAGFPLRFRVRAVT